MQRRTINRDHLWIAALVVLSVIVLTFRLSHPPLWKDEFFALFYTRHSYTHHFSLVRTTDVHPPLYPVILKAWISLFGDSREALRMLSVLFAAAGVPAVYLLARRNLSRTIAVLASLLLIASPLYLHFGREIRNYAMLSAVTVWAVFSFVEFVRRRRQSRQLSWFHILMFVACLTLAFHIHYISILYFPLFGALATWCWLQDRDLRGFGIAFGAIAASAVLCLPQSMHMLGYSMASGAVRNDWIPRTSVSAFYHQTLGAFPFPQYAKPLFLILYVSGAWLTARRSPLLFATTMVFIPGGIILCAVMGIFKGVFLVRSIQTFVLLAPILLAVVLARSPRPLMVGGTLMLAGAGLWSARADYPEVSVANAGAGMKLAFAAPAPNRFLDADIEMELQASDIPLGRWQSIAIERPRSGLAQVTAKLADCRNAVPKCGDTVVVIADHPPFFAAEAEEWRRGIDGLEKIYPATNDRVIAGYRFIRFRQNGGSLPRSETIDPRTS